MLIQKFGGTSVGNPARMNEVVDITNSSEDKIVVLSAVSGTTNKLVELSSLLASNQKANAQTALLAFRAEYELFVDELLSETSLKQRGKAIIHSQFDQIEALFDVPYTTTVEKQILAQGELISTQLFALLMESCGKKALLINALDFMKTNEDNDPDLAYIQSHLESIINANSGYSYFITQGYICRNASGEVDNLQRGGSDYTATLIGAALRADEIQIWTDIDGMHNNDPRIVEDTFPVRKLSYREAAELAYFGAKILHPTCVLPAEEREVPVRLKSTFEPSAPGTLISNEGSGNGITAIAAKDNIIAIKIRSGRMFNAYGFLRRVFEIFEKFKTPIDMITTSEVSVSLTIDDATNLGKIIDQIQEFGEISIDKDQSIICIVGDQLGSKPSFTSNVINAFEEIPVRMISYGGSNNNISVLVDKKYKNLALQSLQSHLFANHVKVVS